MDKHPIAAGVFLALVLAALGGATYRGLHAEPHPAAAPAGTSVKAAIMEAVHKGQAGDLEGAVQGLRAVVAAHPDDTDALFNLGVGLSALGELGEADATFAHLLQLQPQDWEAVAERAAVRREAGRADEAMALLEQIPAGEGRLGLRFSGDERWARLASHGRFGALLAKHGLPPAGAGTSTTAAAP